mmetsp:Transcript_32309/g.57163  ORF Transcript_32309/g.57163 Transcript_32309/m.57163 type:complete len:530 (-) Transcript_32309:67-1656(-)
MEADSQELSTQDGKGDSLEAELEAVLEEALGDIDDLLDLPSSPEEEKQADDGTALDAPAGEEDLPAATALDQSTAATAVDQSTTATALDHSMAATAVDRSTAATAIDRLTAATAVEQSTTATAQDQATAGTAADRPTPATPANETAEAAAEVPPPPAPFRANDVSAAATAVDETAPGSTGDASTGLQAGSTAVDVEELEIEREEMAAGRFNERDSRFMVNEKGELLKKWKVDYAARGGGGRATCKDALCLERNEQGGVKTIEKGCLRIGRRVLMDAESDGGGHVAIMWHHARCMFNTFLRSRKGTRVITSEYDLDGFESILPEDQEMLRRLIDGNQALKDARFRSFDGGAASSTKTPQKRESTVGGGPGAFDPYGGFQSAAKRRRIELEERELRKGDRVWAHFRCRAPDRGDGALGPPIAVKSPKPELAMIREEVVDDTVIVQFEKAEDEKERIEKYREKKFARIRAWLRYPRVFEGKKQKVPVKWLDLKRAPPKLCGCCRQEWAHECPGGFACSRGVSAKVWGVADGA